MIGCDLGLIRLRLPIFGFKEKCPEQQPNLHGALLIECICYYSTQREKNRGESPSQSGHGYLPPFGFFPTSE